MSSEAPPAVIANGTDLNIEFPISLISDNKFNSLSGLLSFSYPLV